MRTRHILFPLLLSACAAEPGADTDIGQGSDDLLFIPIGVNPLAGKPMSGRWGVTSASSDADSTACRGCTFSAGSDAAWSGRTHSTTESDYTNWKSTIPTFGSSAGLPAALDAARAQATSVVDGPYGAGLDKSLCYAWAQLASMSHMVSLGSMSPHPSSMPAAVRDALDYGPLAPSMICDSAGTRDEVVSQIYSVNRSWTRMFPPGYARNLNSETLPSGVNYQLHEYAEPRCLAEMKGRAARAYCGMRSAALAVNGRTLSTGAPSPLGSFLFWNLGEVSGNVRSLKPTPIRMAQGDAFVMPLVIGAKLNPLTGPLVPEFKELTHPLVWVSGDSQHDSNESWGQVGWKWVGTFPNITRQPTYGYRQNYRNTVHADYLMGKEKVAKIKLDDFPLITLWGVLGIDASLEFNFELGKPISHAWADGWAGSRAPDLDPDSIPPGATDARLDILPLNPSNPNNPINMRPYGVGGPYTSWLVDTGTQFGPMVRYNQQDDRAVVLRDYVGTTLGIHAGGSIDWGVLSVSLQVSSTVTSHTQQDSVFREHLSMVNAGQMAPSGGSYSAYDLQTNAILSNEQKSWVDADPFTIDLDFHAELCPFTCFSVDWSKTIFRAKTLDILSKTRRSDETGKLRVGTGSQRGLTNFGRDGQRASTFSHLPGTAQTPPQVFTAQTQTVAQCLAANPNVPGSTLPEMPTPGGPVEAEMCVVFGLEEPFSPTHVPPPRIWSGVCSGPAARQAFLTSVPESAAEASCLAELIDYACPRGDTVDWAGESVFAATIADADYQWFLLKQRECAGLRAQSGPAASAPLRAQETFDMFSLTICQDGVPLGEPNL